VDDGVDVVGGWFANWGVSVRAPRARGGEGRFCNDYGDLTNLGMVEVWLSF